MAEGLPVFRSTSAPRVSRTPSRSSSGAKTRSIAALSLGGSAFDESPSPEPDEQPTTAVHAERAGGSNPEQSPCARGEPQFTISTGVPSGSTFESFVI